MSGQPAGDGFERLATILGWPGHRPFRVDWDAAPEGVRISYPMDYRRFVETYGNGRFAGGLGVGTPLRPRTEQEPTGFETMLRFNLEVGEAIEDWYTWDPGDRPYEPYPAPGGLFLWGNDLSANQFLWDMSNPNPERWPVVVWNPSDEGFLTFETGMSGFLADLLGREHPLSEELIDFESGEPLWQGRV
ncbi:hypothetical protein [Kitasatospora sp. NPDC088783]|uniref:hypothetical protein n=1 Tax=Kitasatospora sp. NPDC088783 TaxID=3364077 RepID=UPI00380A7C83